MASFQQILCYHADAAGQNGSGRCCKTAAELKCHGYPSALPVHCAGATCQSHATASGPTHKAYLQLCCLLCRCSKPDLVQHMRFQADIRAHMLEPISNSPPRCSRGGPCSGRPPAPSHSPAGAPAQIRIDHMEHSISRLQDMAAEGLGRLCKSG